MNELLETNKVELENNTHFEGTRSNICAISSIMLSAVLALSLPGELDDEAFLRFETDTSQNLSANILIAKKSYRDRYQRIAQSEWFKRSYENRSIGELLSLA